MAGSAAGEALRPSHAGHLAPFRIPCEMLETAGVKSVTDTEARDMLGIRGHRGADLSGILFPYRYPVTGERVCGRIRLDTPLPDGGKYISEPGSRHFFFAPGIVDSLKDTSVPVVFVEAEKSCLAIVALADRVGRKLLVIAIGGCWGWKRTIGKRSLADGSNEPETGPSPDLDLVAWKGRTTILAFDSNALTNPKVKEARRAFARELYGRGARVLLADIPAGEGVNGPDDLIALRGDLAMLRAFDSSSEAELDAITLERGKLPSAVDKADEILSDHFERLMIFQRGGRTSASLLSAGAPQGRRLAAF